MGGILGLITARGGSKGVPGKNIVPVGGRPLIEWTIDSGRRSRHLSHLIVSTDDDEIAATARGAGADVPFVRPAELATDTAPHVDVVEHALRWFMRHVGPELDYLVLLQPTSPFRTSDDIDAVLELALGRDANAVVSVCEATEHPYLCRKVREDGSLCDFVPCDIGYRRRQDLPAALHPNGAIYCVRPELLASTGTFFPAKTYPYLMPPERSLQIDTPWDLHLARLIMRDAREMKLKDGTNDTVPAW